MKIERLVKMVNDISDFFNAEPDKNIAIEGIRNHLLRSWEPRMREAIINYYDNSGEGLNELARAAVAKLKS